MSQPQTNRRSAINESVPSLALCRAALNKATFVAHGGRCEWDQWPSSLEVKVSNNPLILDSREELPKHYSHPLFLPSIFLPFPLSPLFVLFGYYQTATSLFVVSRKQREKTRECDCSILTFCGSAIERPEMCAPDGDCLSNAPAGARPFLAATSR